MWFYKLKAHDDKLKTRLKRRQAEACQKPPIQSRWKEEKQTPADSEILEKDAPLTLAVTTSCPGRKQLVSSHHWYP